ncbi:hypothetical protein ACGFI9_20430 [Micromonospora sp. NPDC048930]|uniref:hypothetical protein n=1 Tax=Micromonospora sp. NPDC048930 TaxID=3364261 RepID=UPI00371D2895
MRDLRELFEDAVDPAPPPNRLTAAEVYDAGRRRHHRRLTAAAAAGATALAVAAVAVHVLSPAPLTGDRPPVAGRATTTGETGPIPAGLIVWAGAADRDHLYLALSSCRPGPPCQKQDLVVVGSTDGGRTWHGRGEPVPAGPMTVVGPDTLVAAPITGAAGTEQQLLSSRDGGRTWVPAPAGAPVEAVPDGDAVICWSPQAAEPCVLYAVDPATGAVGPLANQPKLAMRRDELRIDEAAGRLQVTGTDSATGRPAVSTSTDAGRTWFTHVFTDAPPCAKPQCVPLLLAVAGTATAYAVTAVGPDRIVYRSDDAGTRWQRLTAVVPPGAVANTFVTADGSHVLCHLVDGRDADVRRCWALRGGGAYQAVELDGLPTSAGPVRRAPDGWFYAPDPGGVLYGSTDGWHWSPLTRR